jgi:hypothetical protein
MAHVIYQAHPARWMPSRVLGRNDPTLSDIPRIENEKFTYGITSLKMNKICRKRRIYPGASWWWVAYQTTQGGLK